MVYDILIVGGGPSGIALGAEASHAGMDMNNVKILEKADKNSWIIRSLYPDQKLVTANFKGLKPVCHGVMDFFDMGKEDTLNALHDAVNKFSIPIEYNTMVHKIEKEGDIFKLETSQGTFETKICVIAIGIFGKPNKPSYPIPASLKKQTAFDITSTKVENKRVLVVGGGDSAAEYVQHLMEDNNSLAISFREKSTSERMNTVNSEKIKQLVAESSIGFYPNSDITSIEETNGSIIVHFNNNNELNDLECDHIVYALGGTTPINFLNVIGVETDKGVPKLNDSFESNVKDLYIIGDLGIGKSGGSIILGFNSAHNAFSKIKESLSPEFI